MRWADLKPLAFVIVEFKDHSEVWDDEEEGYISTADSPAAEDHGEAIEVTVRGQVLRVSPEFVEIHGGWRDYTQHALGVFRILRSTVESIAPLDPPSSRPDRPA